MNFDFIFDPEGHPGRRIRNTIPTDEKVRYCLKCKRAWQKELNEKNKIVTIYLKDFPTIGKKREGCIECKV